MIELYHSELSVCSSKVRFALAEKQLAYTSHVLNMQAGEHQSTVYRALNPNALVPTLVHDDQVITESTVINEYLDDSFQDRPLRPGDALGRARMRLWTRQLDDGIHELTSVLSFAIAFRLTLLRKTPEELEHHYAGIADPGRRERIRAAVEQGVRAAHVPAALRRFNKLLLDMENTLQARSWLAGADFSLADVGLAPYITRLEHLCLHFLWRDRPRVSAWFARLRQRPAYAASHTQWFKDHPALIETMRHAGEEAAPWLQAQLEPG